MPKTLGPSPLISCAVRSGCDRHLLANRRCRFVALRQRHRTQEERRELQSVRLALVRLCLRLGCVLGTRLLLRLLLRFAMRFRHMLRFLRLWSSVLRGVVLRTLAMAILATRWPAPAAIAVAMGMR